MNRNTTPLLINGNDVIEKLEQVDFADSQTYDEKWLQTLIFENVEILPIHEIDPDFSTLFPVCMELQSSSGRIDCLYATPSGRLVIVEVKLYRNPQSRREVIGQTLDYAKDLNKWSYHQLDSKVRKRTGGVSLFECVKGYYNELKEAQFIDSVHRNLKKGNFLLLVVGDGIREGASEIKDFLTANASLEFTFSMVEMMIYRMANNSLLVQPRILLKTDIVERHVISIESNSNDISASISESVGGGINDEDSMGPSDYQENNLQFWQLFLTNLQLDDLTQPICNTSKSSSLSFSLPPSGSVSWITVFKEKKTGTIGMFIRFVNNETGKLLFWQLKELALELDEKLLTLLSWDDDLRKVSIVPQKIDLDDKANWPAAFDYYSSNLNLLVSEFRPILQRLSS
ncbi:MAG: hypothetical protein OFPI_00960 [Osedax symbiont Rs2]|nr:MAG: hypothetical protein OFPI_00960 [Osedax symbiont Rs2]